MCFSRKKLSLKQRANQTVNSLMSVSELSTVEYTVKKIVKASDENYKLLGIDTNIKKKGDRKILFTCTVYLKAGIDLSKYDPSETEIDEINKTITLSLPHAQLISYNMPYEEQHMVYKKVDRYLLRDDFKAGERNDLLIQAEDNIVNDITNMGILKEAEHNIMSFFELPLKQLGFQIVNFKFKD